MKPELTTEEIRTLLQSLEYSKQRIRDAAGTPPVVRGENLRRLEAAAESLRRQVPRSRARMLRRLNPATWR